MRNEDLFRLSGVAAIIGGLLRMAHSFSAGRFDESVLQASYLITDVFLLFGILGIYLYQSKALGRFGLIGFIVVLVGISIIRGRDLFGVGAYLLGASAFSLGLTVLSVAMLRGTGLSRWIPRVWICTFVAGGAGLIFPSAAAPCAVLAGVLFGAGFVGAGVELTVAHGRRARSEP